MKFTNFKISRKSIFPIENVAHVRSRKTFYHISVHFRNPGFRSVSKPRKPVFIFTTGPTTNICTTLMLLLLILEDMRHPGRQFRRRVTLLTIWYTICSVNGVLLDIV